MIHNLDKNGNIIATYCETCNMWVSGNNGVCNVCSDISEKNKDNTIVSDELKNGSERNIDKYISGESPDYYIGKYKGIKAIDVIYDFELEHNEASALEYILRAGKKDDRVQDLTKAINHLQMKIEHLKNR